MLPNFAVLPPEVNSARVFAGAGSAPMLAAAAAWDDLASELHCAAMSFGSVTSGLVVGWWQGSASAAMVDAAASYIGWLSTSAAHAEGAAGLARAAVSVFEEALAATVHPAMVAANRAQVASLVASNLFGQNAPAIAALESLYECMWAQDAAANLSTFLGGAVTGPYTFPGVLPPSGVPYLLGIQSVLVTQNGQGVSALLGKIGGKPITGALAPLAEFALHTPILGSEGLGGGSVSAGIGRAGLVGKLSVPQGWTVAAPEIPSPAAALQATRLAAAPIAATDGAGALLGGMALSGLAGRAAAGSTGHPIGSAAAPAVGAAAAAVEDLATEANIFVIPAMDD